jgi:predicted phosphoribosyltransferase
MVFASREAAGHMLGQALKERSISGDVVLGLPRGGVVVAAEVAHVLRLPLDVLIVRKIGHPLHREFALGAMAEHGVFVLDQTALRRNPLLQSQLEQIIHEEEIRLSSYQARFRQSPLDLNGKTVLLVDDGLATGATTEAAVLSAKQRGAAKVIVSAPVASTSAVERLRNVADEFFALVIDPEFDAVGRYYDVFSQTTDDEVLDLLRAETLRSS